ncbi:MAG TPA: condensation domain-containing protein, partial [Terriglobales bacterium]|nr:condensation domain-containing protein [Terriglobales bacterium]
MANSVSAGFRLSAQQERVWAQLYGAEAGPCCASATILIEGPLEVDRLHEALRRLVSRHEILRTLFHRQAGLKLPFQVIRDSAEPLWNFAGLGERGAEAEGERQRLLRDLRSRPFDLEQGPTFRALLAELAADRHRLTLDLPVLCADASSLENLTQELGREYAGAPANDEAMQYADVVEWQNEILEGEDTRAGRDFWRDYFRNLDLDALESFSLPFADKPAGGFRPEVFEFALGPGTIASCRAHHDSLRNFLLSCWMVLVSRLTGGETITIGCGFDGRKYQELEDALGVFAKSLPIRATVRSDTRFDAVLCQAGEAVAEASQWQESFAWSKVEGLADSNSVVLPLAFDYREVPARQSLGAVSFELEEVSAPLEPYGLKLEVVGDRGGVRLKLHYDAARLERAAVVRMAGYYQTLLEAAVAAPETPVGRLPLVAEGERQQLLVEWNQTSAAYPAERCLHELFEAQAGRTPERTALVSGTQALSYAEWNRQANRLAH